MLVNPSSFTYEQLKCLKFKELQKLSAQFHVNKRWAKKEELIEKLLQLKDIDLEEGESQGSKQEFDENEWKDGSLVFQQLKSTADNRFDVDRRLTFNIDKTFSSDVIDSRLTFEIPQNDRSAFCKNDEIGSLKEIYEVSSSNISFNTEPLIDPKATFDIPQKGKLLENDIDPRATFDIPQNDKKLFDGLKGLKDENKSSNTQEKIIIQLKGITINNTQIKTNAEEKLQFESASKDERKKSYNKGQTEIKTLTVPYTRVPRRNKKVLDDFRSNNSPMGISKKSINIKKSRLPSKFDLIKSPIRKPIGSHTDHSMHALKNNKIMPSKIPKILYQEEKKLTELNMDFTKNENNKENVTRVLQRRKSKTADEVLIKKSNEPKVSFMSPQISLSKDHKALLPLRKSLLEKEIDKKTPGKFISSTPNISAKPILSTKMPDFNKIHKKYFEQMDSLPDYLKKKEERTRKLFGTPQQRTQTKILNKPTVFRFDSSATMKPESKYKSNENLLNAKIAQKEAIKNRLPPSKVQTDIKDKKRSHIHGVRTNKRFELQMKLRNM